MPNSKTTKPRRSYGGISAKERRKERRTKLIEAGFTLFGTRGFNDTKIEQVCAEAGVGIRSLYEEFGSLEALFRAVYDDIMDDTFEALTEALSEKTDESDARKLETGISAYLHRMLDDERNGRIVSIESGRLDAYLGTHRNDTLKRFASLADMHLIEQSMDPTAKSVWSTMLAGALNEIIIAALVSDTQPDIDKLASIATRIWQSSLKG